MIRHHMTSKGKSNEAWPFLFLSLIWSQVGEKATRNNRWGGSKGDKLEMLNNNKENLNMTAQESPL